MEDYSDEHSNSSLEKTLHGVSAKLVEGIKFSEINNFSLKKSKSEGQALIGSINESEEYIS